MQQQCHNLDRLGQRLAAEDWQCCQVGNPLRSLLQGRKHRLGDIVADIQIAEAADNFQLRIELRHMGDDQTLFGELLHRTAQTARTPARSEEHTSELQSLMRISYAVFRLKKKKQQLYT